MALAAPVLSDLATYPRTYVPLSHLAAYWGVSRVTLWRYCRQGYLPYVRCAGVYTGILTRAALQFEPVIMATRPGPGHPCLRTLHLRRVRQYRGVS